LGHDRKAAHPGRDWFYNRLATGTLPPALEGAQ
jgi:hypothetical protein